MQINRLSEYFNKNSSLFAQNNDNSVNNSFSIFTLMNKCLEKADTSGDGTLSDKEISAFMKTSTVDILNDLQKELGHDAQIDIATVQQMLDMVKTVMGTTDEISEDVSELKDISQDDFIKNANDAANDENGSAFWKTIGTDNAEKIFSSLDTDGDKTLSEAELNAIASLDGNNDNLSLTDLCNFFKTTGLGSPVDGTQTPEASESTEGSSSTPAAQDTQSSSSGGSSGGGSYDGSGDYSGNNGANTNNVDPVQNQTRTKEDVEKEITEQETLRSTTTSDAEKEISEQENLISNAIKESDLSDEFKNEYNTKNTELTAQITDKETKISEQRSLEENYTAQAQAYTNAYNSIDSQISTMETEKASFDTTNDSDKISDYTTKIENLKNEKSKLEADKKQAEENAAKAKADREALEKEKADLETQKDNILDTLSEKYTGEKEKAAQIKENIAQYQNKINEIKTKLNTDLSTIDSNVQTLKNEKVQIEQDEKTKEVLEANSGTPNTTPVGINGDISTFTQADWEKLGYNAQTGNTLGTSALEVGQKMQANGSMHNCLGGVKRSFINALGSSPFGKPNQGITSACKCLKTMQGNNQFREITGITSSKDLKYLPKGAVIVWDKSGTGSAAGQNGHISISLGDGRESSDHICSQYKSVGGRKDTYHVFIPV